MSEKNCYSYGRVELTGQDGGVLVTSPPPEGMHITNSIVSVYLRPDEEVEWHWTETPTGRYVCGYTIIKRLPDSGAEGKQ